MEKSKFHDHTPIKDLDETRELIELITNDILINKIEITIESEKILEFNRDMLDENYLILRTQELLKKVEAISI